MPRAGVRHWSKSACHSDQGGSDVDPGRCDRLHRPAHCRRARVRARAEGRRRQPNGPRARSHLPVRHPHCRRWDGEAHRDDPRSVRPTVHALASGQSGVAPRVHGARAAQKAIDRWALRSLLAWVGHRRADRRRADRRVGCREAQRAEQRDQGALPHPAGYAVGVAYVADANDRSGRSRTPGVCKRGCGLPRRYGVRVRTQGPARRAHQGVADAVAAHHRVAAEPGGPRRRSVWRSAVARVAGGSDPETDDRHDRCGFFDRAPRLDRLAADPAQRAGGVAVDDAPASCRRPAR